MPYIFIIRDPLNSDDGSNIKFVGQSYQPWIAVQNHLLGSANSELAEWGQQLLLKNPEGLDILGEVVCRMFHGDIIDDLPEPPLGRLRVRWEIVDYVRDEFDAEPLDDRQVSIKTSRRNFWVKKYSREGHQLFNKKTGRPKKDLVTS